MDNSPLADIPLLPGYGYAALMENPSGLPQGLGNALRCPHTHSPTTIKTFFSLIELEKRPNQGSRPCRLPVPRKRR
jgi:hypothetical protein